MTTSRTKESRVSRRKWLAFFALVALSSFAPDRAAAGGNVLVVVTSKDSPVDELSLADLRQIYLGSNIQAKDGSRILALNRSAGTRERVDFDRAVLRMGPDRVARYWIDRRIRGQSGSPKAVDPAPLIQKVVSRLPGAIAYVHPDQVSSAVKVVRIEGRDPSDPDYPVRD